jgi:hypothetical protein
MHACSTGQSDRRDGPRPFACIWKDASGPTFFETLRAHTIEGMLSDPVHGGDRVFAGWRLLGYPGPQPSYGHAEQQLDAVIVRQRIFSAADYPLSFSEDGDP